MKTALVIAGPTATGKSAVAIDLAEALGGEIINADAMQVYRELRVLTARPPVEDEARVPHHLYGASRGDDPWSAGRFAREAARVLDDVAARGRLPIIVGGTGLWLKALTHGLSPIPDVPEAARAEAARVLAEEGIEELRRQLLVLDPAMESLNHGDTQRHLRALSVALGTERPLSEWQKEPARAVSDARFVPMVLMPERSRNYASADGRFEAMLKAGAREEVEALLAETYAPTVPVMKAVGVPELAQVARGVMTLGEATEAAQMQTRRLIKRQSTFFSGQLAAWPKFEEADALKAAAMAALS